MKTYKVKEEYTDLWVDNSENITSVVVSEADVRHLAYEWGKGIDELMGQLEEIEEEITLKISKIAIKSETFCTTWNGELYCVDICEDAEDRSAWIYSSDGGFKMLMWGEDPKQDSREDFLNRVFSNLPDYIDVYEDEMNLFVEAAMENFYSNND